MDVVHEGQPSQRGRLRMHSHSWSDAGRRGRRWQVGLVVGMVMINVVMVVDIESQQDGGDDLDGGNVS